LIVPGQPLIIVGAGGLGRETAELARTIDHGPEILGFADDDPGLHGTVIGGLAVLGPAEICHQHDAALVVLAAASPARPDSRLRLADRLGLPDDRFATLVHPSAVVPSSALLAPGTIIHAGCVLTADIEVGRHVAMMPATVLTHDDRVGDFATFGAGVRVAGRVTIGRGAYLGAGSLIREDLNIGDGAVVGMGAVVARDVPSGETWAGNPARRLRY
jgi:sugar O-acyltransferase (sialic acid O-acetyltransferase NeuD family)